MLVQIETKTRNCLISRYDVQLALSKIDPYLANLGNEFKLTLITLACFAMSLFRFFTFLK